MSTRSETLKVLVILGHPDSDSFCGSLAATYSAGAKSAGHEVRYLALGELNFDPVLKHGYRAQQTLEPDLVRAQELILWAEVLVFVYPNWWGLMPALLKGFFDRVFLPGFAFKYRKNSPLWDKLLVGRSAELLVTMDTPAWYYRWIFRRPGYHAMKRTILEFCGIRLRKFSTFAPMHGSTEQKRKRWLDQAHKLGVGVKH